MSVTNKMLGLLEAVATSRLLAEDFYCIHCDKKFKTAGAASDANDQHCDKSPYKDKTHYTRPEELNLSQGQASAKIKAFHKKRDATLAKMKTEDDPNYSKAKMAFDNGYGRDWDYLKKIGAIDQDDFNFVTWYDRQVLAGDLLPESVLDEEDAPEEYYFTNEDDGNFVLTKGKNQFVVRTSGPTTDRDMADLYTYGVRNAKSMQDAIKIIKKIVRR